MKLLCGADRLCHEIGFLVPQTLLETVIVTVWHTGNLRLRLTERSLRSASMLNCRFQDKL